MRLISWDLETHIIKPGLLTPRMVCLSYAERDQEPGDTPGPLVVSGLVLREEGLVFIERWLRDDDVVLLGHNITFDLGVVAAERPELLPLIFEKYEKGLVRDTLTNQQMLDIASGEMKYYVDEDGEPKHTVYTLAALAYRLLKKFLVKKDTWRLKYALLDGVPLADWPEDAKKYAIDDAVTTLEVFEKQMEIAGVPEIPNAKEQFKAAWSLHLMSAWGVRTNGAAVEKLRKELQRDYEEALVKLRQTDLIKQVKKKGVMTDVKDTKAMRARVTAAFTARGEPVPHTDPGKRFPDGQVATDKKTMKDSGDPDLILLSESIGTQKLLSTYIPALMGGTKVPINARFNALVETGRTSCSGPNLQNPPRKGGVRECIVPRGCS